MMQVKAIKKKKKKAPGPQLVFDTTLFSSGRGSKTECRRSIVMIVTSKLYFYFSGLGFLLRRCVVRICQIQRH